MNYLNRREKLLAKLEANSMVILFSGQEITSSNDQCYPFQVNRNFYYLTGIDRENMILVLLKNKFNHCQEILFIEKYDELKAKWVGARMLPDEARKISGINDIRYVEEFDDHLTNLVNSFRSSQPLAVYFDLEKRKMNGLETQAHRYARLLKHEFCSVLIKDVFEMITSMRMIKDEDEIAEIVKANQITKNALEYLLKNMQPGLKEYQLEALFDFGLMNQGCRLHAFNTICAGGKNACVLHYVDNNCEVKDEEMVLFDLGATSNYYNADISRTYPISKRYTDRQKQLYNIVLEAQENVIKAIRVGVTLRELNDIVIKTYEKYHDIIGPKPINSYYFHGVSHHLGLDTHDVTIFNQPLEVGNVITVEPGLYIEDEKIGIRIEDDVLVTASGYRNLSEGVIKTIEDIEQFMKG